MSAEESNKKRKITPLTAEQVDAALSASVPASLKPRGPTRDLTKMPMFGPAVTSGAYKSGATAAAAAVSTASSSSSSSSAFASASDQKRLINPSHVGLLMEKYKPIQKMLEAENPAGGGGSGGGMTNLMESVFLPLLQQLVRMSPMTSGTARDATALKELAESKYSTEKWQSKLVYQSAQYEDMLLFEGGDKPRPSPTKPGLYIRSPACCAGDQCVVQREKIPGLFNPGNKNATLEQKMMGSGFTLMIHMTEEELKNHHETGAVPTDSAERWCLLCQRHLTTSLVLALTLNPNVEFPRHSLVTKVFNKKNCVGGYRSEYLLTPSETGWNGLAAPTAKFDISGLIAVYDKASGCRRVLQDRMKFHELTDPKQADALNSPYQVKFFQS